MKKNSNKGKTITVKIKYDDFTQETRSKTIDRYISKKEDFFPIIEQLIFYKNITKSVRLLGISITNLYKKDVLPIKDYSLQLKFDF
jgi:DNA polymerase-4